MMDGNDGFVRRLFQFQCFCSSCDQTCRVERENSNIVGGVATRHLVDVPRCFVVLLPKI